ncbi:MAG: 1-acyl-sn-glycerol-3-phosphate acyltransferase [Victivallales bacterium]|nr:1-acyl-sn-glycerol-3-phosphate acyltransferase [Victivallales bacterium]MBT7163626.1 1-acyl-sn-glycerol-3-phosphate acyltransferase [Victivallales bacterium]
MFQLTPPAYHSPDDTHPSLLQRLIPWCTRLPFYARTIRSLLKGRRQSLRGEFCDQVFSDRAVDILRAVEKAGGKVHITGLEHIAGTPGPAVFAGNHMSMLEIFLLPAAISPHKGVGFVVKESLGRNWLMGPVVDAQQAIQVGRTNAREDLATVLREGQERLGRNHSMIIFPQGTRSDSFPVSRFNSLGVKLAKRAGVPLIPFAAKTDFLANGRWVKDLGPVHPERDVHIAFGPAITDVSDQKTAQQTCIDFIRTKLTEWGATCVE